MSQAVTDTHVAEEDLLRADLYDFLAALLANPPSKDLLQHAAALGGDDSDLGQAISTLARVAKATNAAAVETEFNALFIGLGRGELMPFASYYLTGFLNEKPLASLRADMAALRITRAPNVYEPEDNIASLLEMMAGMIRGRFGEPVPLQKAERLLLHPYRRLGGALLLRFGSGAKLGALRAGGHGGQSLPRN